ncbi:MAG: fluoride efflux transporter CrcB [Opitutales bacterium]
MQGLTPLLWVGLGGAAGAMLRAWLSLALTHPGQFLPWSTLLANVAGSLLLGIVFAVESHTRGFLHPHARDLLAVGFCGGFTTFSTFSLQTLNLLRDGKADAALANIALNLVLTLCATAVGYTLTRVLLTDSAER